LDIDLFWVGTGLAALGYFIGEGLKNFKNPSSIYKGYPSLIKEKNLHIYLGLSKEEIKDLLMKHPDIPKVELNGTTYYPHKQLLEWLSSSETFNTNRAQ
jgi:hypothetical protein